MKKRKLGLFPKVLIAITIGSLLGLIAPDIMIRILKTFNVFFAQILKFIVPLLVLGLVTPSVANLGRGAGKMLLSVIVISYLSTIGAGFFAYGCASNLLPHYLSIGEISTSALEGKVFEPYFNIKFPPICDILTALLLSFMLGVGIIFTKAPGLKKAFDEFGEIVKLTIERAIIPLLPFYIFTMICEMSAAGHLSTVMGTGIKVIATGVILSICYLIIQYIIAGLIAKKNPFKCIWKHYSGISDRLFNLLQFGCYSCHSRMYHEKRCHQRDRQFYRPSLFYSPYVRVDYQTYHYIGCSDVSERNEYQFCPLCQFHSFTRNFCRSCSRSNGRCLDGIDRITGICSRFFAGTKCLDDDHLSGSRRIWPGM